MIHLSGLHFKKKCVDQDGENQAEDEIHHLDIDSPTTFLTKEEHDITCIERGDVSLRETTDFRRGYQLEVLDEQKQINLRNEDVPIVRNKDVGNKAYTSKPKGDIVSKEGSKNVPDPKGKDRREENLRSAD